MHKKPKPRSGSVEKPKLSSKGNPWVVDENGDIIGYLGADGAPVLPPSLALPSFNPPTTIGPNTWGNSPYRHIRAHAQMEAHGRAHALATASAVPRLAVPHLPQATTSLPAVATSATAAAPGVSAAERRRLRLSSGTMTLVSNMPITCTTTCIRHRAVQPTKAPEPTGKRTKRTTPLQCEDLWKPLMVITAVASASISSPTRCRIVADIVIAMFASASG
ncbi:hypothetical protein C8J57DRAFT_1529750 [Mycena rebaudengoi]|nr:hypothetical protein C8J57DRAFT_1529750 [Mycena rebaudengoi]